VWALLRVRPAGRQRAGAHAAGAEPAILQGVDRLAGPATVIRCLVLFNTAFAVQTVLDVMYLWRSGAQLPGHLTWAEYAHRGAYPLMATALLAGLFVLISFRDGGGSSDLKWARRLVYLWIGQNLFLLFSALWRLGLYVEVYSLTRWRVAAAIWMGLVAIGFAWIVVRLATRRPDAWLLRVNVLTAIAVLYLCCFIDFDGRIAWYNVRHCQEAGGSGTAVDLDYLSALGPEALPALDWLARKVDDPAVANKAARCFAQRRDQLEKTLEDWRGWTARRARLRAATTTAAVARGVEERAR
jgi:hypothetical protein